MWELSIQYLKKKYHSWVIYDVDKIGTYKFKLFVIVWLVIYIFFKLVTYVIDSVLANKDWSEKCFACL